MCNTCDEILANTFPNDRNAAFTPCRIKAWFASPAKSMTIYCYRTGNDLRPATAQEIARYEETLAAMPNDAGAVDGSEFGHDGPVYMER